MGNRKWKKGMVAYFAGLYPSEVNPNFKFSTVLAGRIKNIQLRPSGGPDGCKVHHNVAMVEVKRVAEGCHPIPMEKPRLIPVSPSALRETLDEATHDCARNYAKYRARLTEDAQRIQGWLDLNAEHMTKITEFELFGLDGV